MQSLHFLFESAYEPLILFFFLVIWKIKFQHSIFYGPRYECLWKSVNLIKLATAAKKYLSSIIYSRCSPRCCATKLGETGCKVRQTALCVERARHFVNTLCNALDLSEWGTYRLIDNQSIRKYLFFIIIFACTVRVVYGPRAIAFVSRSRHYKLHICILAFRKNHEMMMWNAGVANCKMQSEMSAGLAP